MQETANTAEVLAELFDGNTCTANAAEVLALKEEVEKLKALVQAPKRGPGRPWPKKESAPASKKRPGRPWSKNATANAEAEGEPAPKRAKPGRPVGSKKQRLTPTQGSDAEANADTPPAKRKPGRPKTVKREVEVELETPCETDSGRKPRVKEIHLVI